MKHLFADVFKEKKNPTTKKPTFSPSRVGGQRK